MPLSPVTTNSVGSLPTGEPQYDDKLSANLSPLELILLRTTYLDLLRANEVVAHVLNVLREISAVISPIITPCQENLNIVPLFELTRR